MCARCIFGGEMKKIKQQECRQIQLAILDEIAKICKENNLKYYLAYGTLIGAVRHKGYIPWDDDVDICLVREDYDKLLSILKNRDLNKVEWLSVVDSKDAHFYHPFAKAVDNRTEVKMDRHKDTIGIWVDLFPLDGLSSSMFKAKVQFLVCSFLRIVALAMSTDFSSRTLSFGTLLYKRFFYGLATLIGKKRICRLTERIMRRYAVKDSKYIGMLFSAYLFDAIFEKERLLPQATYQFEDRFYTGFADYDYYLRQSYGDYMVLPPKEKRITHDFDAWWKQEK